MDLSAASVSWFVPGTLQQRPPLSIASDQTAESIEISEYRFKVEVYPPRWRLVLEPVQEKAIVLHPRTELVFNGSYLYELLEPPPEGVAWFASIRRDKILTGPAWDSKVAVWTAFLTETLPEKERRQIPNPFALGKNTVRVDWTPFSQNDLGPPKKLRFHAQGGSPYEVAEARMVAESSLQVAFHLTVPKTFHLDLYRPVDLQHQGSSPKPFYRYIGTVTNAGILRQSFPGPPKLPEAGPIRLLDHRFDPNSPIMLWISDHWPSEAEVRRTPEYRRWAALTGQGVPSKWSRVIGLLLFLVLLEGFFFLVWYMRKAKRGDVVDK